MKPNWIKAAYETPDTTRHVLACRSGYITMAVHDWDNSVWYAIDDEGGWAGDIYDVTHWCELPELPSEGGGDE